MYNGIGLKTARGTATSGYVQRNLAANQSYEGRAERRKRLLQEETESKARFQRTNIATRKVDPKIAEHEKKRAVEVRCMELRLQLEKDSLDKKKIDQQVSALRDRLTNHSQRSDKPYTRPLRGDRPRHEEWHPHRNNSDAFAHYRDSHPVQFPDFPRDFDYRLVVKEQEQMHGKRAAQTY